MIEPSVEEANQEVVKHGKDPRASEGVVSTNVGHYSNLRCKWNVRAEMCILVEWTLRSSSDFLTYRRNDRKSLVKGPLVNHLMKGLKMSSLHP